MGDELGETDDFFEGRAYDIARALGCPYITFVRSLRTTLRYTNLQVVSKHLESQ